MEHNIIKNEINRKYAPLAIIQHYALIVLMVNGVNNKYLDLTNSRLQVLA